MLSIYLIFVFFFKQKTAYEMRISDWSSDVCSSDLAQSERGRYFVKMFRGYSCPLALRLEDKRSWRLFSYPHVIVHVDHLALVANRIDEAAPADRKSVV